MTTFEKNPHDRLTRRCIHCGTPFHSHAEGTQECPQRYRPGSLEEAERMEIMDFLKEFLI